jgi:tRNA-splicing ligase RtcB
MSRNEANAASRSPTRSAPPPTSSAARTAEVIDEIPMAYKDIDAVMHAQRALVEIVHTCGRWCASRAEVRAVSRCF